MRIRRSTALLIVAWLATFVLYLQVRPDPKARATYDPATTATVPLPAVTAPPTTIESPGSTSTSTTSPAPTDGAEPTTTTTIAEEPETSTTTTSDPAVGSTTSVRLPATTSTTGG